VTTNPSDEVRPNEPVGTGAGDSGPGRRVDSDAPPPGTSQGRTEPIPPSGDKDEADEGHPAEAPAFDDRPTSIGSGNPQAPSLAVLPSADDGTGAATPARPPSHGSEGYGSRTPGDMGVAPAGEPIETDVQTSAARTQPGHPPGSVVADEPTPGELHAMESPGPATMTGTSEESGVVRGARTPAP
jgi:hypothetical protein